MSWAATGTAPKPATPAWMKTVRPQHVLVLLFLIAYPLVASPFWTVQIGAQALFLGVRNLDRVELMLNNEVHPYDLLRYERAIFSKAAIELLGESLKKTVSKRKLAAAAAAQKEVA